MQTPFTYTIRYTLDKSHYSETYDESIIHKPFMKAYGKSIFFLAVGLIIMISGILDRYLAWFFVGLAVVDACSVYFAKPWWLARQLISEAANNDLSLTIDEKGVNSQSFSVKSEIPWNDMTQIEKTNRGWLIYHSGGRYYVSTRCLSEEAEEYMRGKSEAD